MYNLKAKIRIMKYFFFCLYSFDEDLKTNLKCQLLFQKM